MDLTIAKVPLADVRALRDLFLAEIDFQYIYNKCHGAGWADTYLFTIDGIRAGYGSIWGKDKREDRDAIFEFYLLPPYRKMANTVFPEFCKSCKAKYVEYQSNDGLLSQMAFEFSRNIYAEAILFGDSHLTNLNIPDVTFGEKQNEDDEVEYYLEKNGQVVATGGYVWNYNFPYIDMYYEVKEGHRQQGFGSLITQELKREAYLLDRIPAARCNINNKASKATLLKAGMRVCGHILIGELLS